MTFLGLMVRSAFRNWLRTSLTSLGVAVTLLAFLLLRTMVASWYTGLDAAALDRVIVRNKISTAFPLSTAHVQRTRGVAGVEDLSFSSWFGGNYLDEREPFPQLAVDGESFLRLYPELQLAPEQVQAWLGDRAGAVAGDRLARKYGWKVGDKIVLQGTIYPGDWDLTLRGIFTARHDGDREQLLFHWKYLDDKVEEGRRDQVGTIVARTSGDDVGRRIDKLFANSLSETRTESELAFQRSFIAMAGGVLSAMELVSGVVLAILILVLGNTMAMATRERTREYAAMRAIGFRPWHVVTLVLGEGFMIGAAGVAGALLAAPQVLALSAELMRRKLGGFIELPLRPGSVVAAVVVALASAMLAAALPAWQSGRLRVAEALRRTER